MKKKIIYIFLTLVLLLSIGFGVFYNYLIPNFVKSEVLYASVSTDSLMRESELIFVGEVTAISETRWNQDNGRFWTDGMPYYTITLSVIDPIIGEMKDEVVITVLESSPLDASTFGVESDSEDVILREYPLEMNEKAVIFAHPTEIAWRNPNRVPAIVFNGYPRGATYLEGEDGRYHSLDGAVFTVEELTAEIAQRRKEN